MSLTKPQRLMLEALRDACDQKRPDGQPVGYGTPRQLAYIRWPDSPGWRKRSNRGSTPAGGALGATMPMKAATVLWKLQRHGLAWTDYDSRWEITSKGRNYLEETK